MGAQEIGVIFGIITALLLFLGIPALFILALIKTITKKSKGWIALLIITSILGLGAIGIIAFGAHKGFKQIADNSEKSEVKSSDGTCLIEIPGNWSEIPDSNEDASIAKGNLFKEQYVMVISESKADLEEEVSLQTYGEIVLQMMEESLKEAQYEQWEVSDLTHPLSGMTCHLSGSMDGIKIKYLLTVTEDQGHFYQILQWSIPSKWEKALPVFQEILKSFRSLKNSPEKNPASKRPSA